MDPDLEEDKSLMWIARQGLMEPVPEPWQALKDSNDNIIYINATTKEKTHQHPCDELYRQLFEKEKRALMQKIQRMMNQNDSKYASNNSGIEPIDMEEESKQNESAIERDDISEPLVQSA